MAHFQKIFSPDPGTHRDTPWHGKVASYVSGDTPWHGDQIFKQKEIPILFLDYLGFVGSIVDMYSVQLPI